jgi:hypothetical protein
MSPFSLPIYKGNERVGIQKIRKRGIRGSENKGNEEKGYLLDACAGPSISSQVDLLCIMSSMLVLSSWMLI